jgi:hypothetical protein
MSCLRWFCLFDPSYKELETLYVNKQKQRKQDMIPPTKNWRHYT